MLNIHIFILIHFRWPFWTTVKLQVITDKQIDNMLHLWTDKLGLAWSYSIYLWPHCSRVWIQSNYVSAWFNVWKNLYMVSQKAKHQSQGHKWTVPINFKVPHFCKPSQHLLWSLTGVILYNLHSELLLYVQCSCATIKNELQGPLPLKSNSKIHTLCFNSGRTQSPWLHPS